MRSNWRGLGIALGVLVAVAHTSTAHAQAESSAFEEGVRAWDEERYDDALDAFITAFERTGNPLVLLNIAAAHEELGHLAAAADAYRRLLASSDPRVARHAPLARESLARIAPRLAHLTVRYSALVASDAILVDDAEVDRSAEAEGTLALELDPGPHRAVLRRADAIVGERSVSLLAGESASVELEAPPLPDPVEVAVAPRPNPMMHAPSEPPIEESPWLWLGVGAGAAVIAAIVIGVVVAASGGPSTFMGSFEPGQIWVH